MDGHVTRLVEKQECRFLSTSRKDPGKKEKPLSLLCPSASGGRVDLSLRPGQPGSDNYTPSE